MINFAEHTHLQIVNNKTGEVLVDSEKIGECYYIPRSKFVEKRKQENWVKKSSAEHLYGRFWNHIPARKTVNLDLLDADTGEVLAIKVALNNR